MILKINNKEISFDGYAQPINSIQELIVEIYNMAIDDFESKLIMHFADWKLSNAPFNDDETDRTRYIICETIEDAICGVKEIAEQLKEGVKE